MACLKKTALSGWLLWALLSAWDAGAQTCTNIATGMWNNAANWNCTVLPANRVPADTDNVVIINNTTVTVDVTGAGAQAGSVTILGGANTTALNLGGVGTSLTVTNAGGLSGNVVIEPSTANVFRTLAVGARSLIVTGSVTINGGTAGGGGNNTGQLTVTSGTASIGSLALNAGTVNNNRAQTTVTTGRIDVAGDVTLTGGGVNSRDALLSVSGVSAVGNGINIGGTLNINATVATSSTAQITSNGGRITVNGAGGVNNGDRVTVNNGIFSVTNPAATFTNSNNTIAVQTAVTGGTLAIAGNAAVTGGATGSSLLTVSTGVITVGGNLSVTAGPNNSADATARVTTTGRMTVTGDVTVIGGAANNQDALLTVGGVSAVGQGINIGGTLNVNATVAGSSTVSITSNGGRITVDGAGGVNNGDTVAVGNGIFTVSNAGAAFATSSATNNTNTSVTGGTLSIAGNAAVAGGAAAASAATFQVSTGVISVGGNLAVTPGTNAGGDVNAFVTGTGRMDVTGNVTVTGGTTNGHDALLRVSGVSAVGQGINIGGTLNVNAAVAGSSTISITSNGGRITVDGAGGVNNGDTVAVGNGIFTVSNGGATFVTGSTTNSTTTTVTGGTLSIAGNATVTGGPANPSAATFSVSTGVISVGGNLSVTAGTHNNGDATASVTNTGRMDVNGDVTTTGGANNAQDALLLVSGVSAAGQGINVGGTLNVNATVAGSSTASITSAGGRITVNGAGGVNNRDTVAIGAGIFTVSNAAATYANSNGSIVASTTVSSGTLSILGTLNNATAETMTVSTTGNITVGDTVGYAGTLTNAGTITLTAGGIVNANGTFTNSGTFTNTAAGQLFLRGATSTVNGTFNRGTGTVTMNGGAAQNLSGSAITGPAIGASLYNLTIDNTSGVTLGNNVRVVNTITFTSGNVITGANVLISVRQCHLGAPPAVSRTSGHVVGNFQKTLINGGSTCTFEIGSSADYTPATLIFTGVAAANSGLIAFVGSPVGDHPNIATSGLDASKSVNRWWGLTTTGVSGTAVSFTSYNATFTFINPGDLDGGVNTANLEIERRLAGAWNTTTAGTRNPTDTQAINITVLGEFAIAEKTATVTPPGDLNAFETSTAGGAITGPVYTKLVGANFNLAIVAILGGVQHATFNEAVTVDLVTGSTGGLNCPGAPAAIAGTSQNVTLVNGRVNTTTGFTLGTAYRNVRVRIRYPVASPTVTSCSSDNFAIRPPVFTVSSTNATETGTGGATVFKTGAFFNLTATSVAGYDGTPLIDNGVGKVIGTPNQGTIGGTFGAAPIGTGIAVGNSFFYSEVGNFGLAANAIYDSSFTSDSSDIGNGHCIPGSFSNVLSGGQYGCAIGSTAVAQTTSVSGFGRFIPDNFDVSTNAPSFGNELGCGLFTYVGRSFTYSTAPVMTVTARKGTNNGLDNSATTNYAGSYVKLTNATLTPNTQDARYTRFDALSPSPTPALITTGLPGTASDPTIGAFTNGLATLTFSSGTGLIFTRSTTTPNAPFDADIALALNVIDSDSVVFAGNPASFHAATAGNGIPFTGGKAMRFGRLRLQNASGSQLLPLSFQAEAQYWNGSSFITNAADGCTVVNPTHIAMGAYTGTLAPAPNCLTAVSGGGTLGAGRTTFQLAAPGGSINGSVTLTANLAAVPSGNTCIAVGGAPAAATTANRPYLQGGAAFNQNPAARATFGVRRGSEELIHNRENF